MNTQELIEKTKWKQTGSTLNKEIKGLFVGDLLSYVMGNSHENQVWITMQNHLNSIGVASLKEFAAIILIDSLEFDQDALKKAIENDVCILSSPDSAIDTIRTLLQLGL